MRFNTETMLTTAIVMPATFLDIAVPLSLRDAGETAFTGAMNQPSIDLFRYTAPLMLARLKACGPAADPQLSYWNSSPLAAGTGTQE